MMLQGGTMMTSGEVEGPTLAFLGSSSASTGGGLTATWSNADLGPAFANRRIVVGFAHVIFSEPGFSVTVDGVSATQVANYNNDVYMYVASVPSGTSGDIVVTGDGAWSEDVGFAAWAINTPSATTYDSFGGGSSVSIDIPSNGVAIAVSRARNGSSGSISGLANNDVDFDFYTSDYLTGASEAEMSLETGRSISRSGADAICAASWET